MTLAVACGGSSDVTGPPGGGGGGGGGAAAVASVTITPGSANLLVDVVDTAGLGSATLTATPKDAAGNTLSGRAIAWSSSDTTVAKVSATGVVRAVAAGTSTIKATSENQSGQISVTVTRPAVSQVTVTPLNSSIKVGATETLTITVLDAEGHQLRRPIIEINNSPGVISVLTGNVTGVAAGTGTVTIKSENNVPVTATITVTP